MHPTTTTKPMHMALRDGQATACNERDPRSHGYHYFSHVLAPSESCLCAGNVSATELFLRLQQSSPDHMKPLGAGFCDPNFILAPKHLAHIRFRTIARKALKAPVSGSKRTIALALHSESRTLSSPSAHTA
jgi:hypothetical protein